MNFAFLLAIFLLFIACPSEAKDESCIQCHTDESILESLVRVPTIKPSSRIGPAGQPKAFTAKTYYTRYLIDGAALKKDPHFDNGCSFCHKGDETSIEQEKAHKGVVNKPSTDLKLCGDCHADITEGYQGASHFTLQGMLAKTSRRFSKKEEQLFTEKVFGQSCRTCHASCGDCHVKSPSKDGVSDGFISGHRFIKKDEGKTCGVCHGGRIYPEYTGKNGVSPDVHFQKGMACIDCHKKNHIHGGTRGIGKNEKTEQNTPKCSDCHKAGRETKTIAKLAHTRHKGNVSCYGCHSQGEYISCYDCHIGQGATSKLGLILGLSSKDKRNLTTLRAIPVTRETFLDSGIKMENYDQVPDYRAASVHNIQKVTERTHSCDACHIHRKGFLSQGSIMKNGSKANEDLIFRMRPLSID